MWDSVSKNMWNTLQKEEELPEWAILLPNVQDIQDWRPKRISRIFGNQDWKETRWDTRMNSANPDIANFEKSQVRRRGAQRRTKHPNIKYHHWREEVRKGIINISTYHTGTKWQKADKPFSDLLTNVWRKKDDEGLRSGSTLNRIHYYIEMRECEYTYILGALTKIYSGTQERSKRTRGDGTYAAGYWLPNVRHQALHSDRILCYALCYVT
jgi:hypothetical protein